MSSGLGYGGGQGMEERVAHMEQTGHRSVTVVRRYVRDVKQRRGRDDAERELGKQ